MFISNATTKQSTTGVCNTHSRMFSEILSSSCAAFKQFLRYCTGSYQQKRRQVDICYTNFVSMLICISQLAHCHTLQIPQNLKTTPPHYSVFTVHNICLYSWTICVWRFSTSKKCFQNSIKTIIFNFFMSFLNN